MCQLQWPVSLKLSFGSPSRTSGIPKRQERSAEASCDGEVCRAVHSGGKGWQLPPRGKRNVFFSNVVFDFAGIFLIAILVRNFKKTD